MSAILAGSLSVLGFFLLAGIYALKAKRNDLADVLWGFGFIVAIDGAVLFRDSSSYLAPSTLLSIICVMVWGLRLTWHIGRRFIQKSKEDARYAKWRNEWGKTWVWRSYLQVWTLQPLILILIVLPVLRAIDKNSTENIFWPLLGIALWLIGFFFESVGDAQLKKFSADPANKGKIIQQGLWSWSRHPNYFGEVVQWWGIYLMTFSPEDWWLIISPLTITFLIWKVSGVSMLEEMMKDRPGFEEYKRRTSIFFPLPPKKI